MSTPKTSRPKARLPRGFRDRPAADISAERGMLEIIRKVYESYGFEPLETPTLEYTDALGKFLPDLDRPNEGVFSLKDDDGQWLSLRYDLTAPLARYVAENLQHLPKPFRRYQVGTVWRNEKPGPGRYREFTQFDADTVGSASPVADAELLMMVCDALEALGFRRGEYVVKVNSRRLLDGILEAARVDAAQRGAVLRAIDKYDRLGLHEVMKLLGPGRKDESGDFTKGAGLSDTAITAIVNFTGWGEPNTGAASSVRSNRVSLFNFETYLDAYGGSATGNAGISELRALDDMLARNSYLENRVLIDPSIIRGLEYYTGPVFEAQLTVPVKNEADEAIVFGSVAGGGRYDDLVARFTGQQVPATGISIGVSRLLSAVRQRADAALSPLVVLLTTDDAARSFVMARELREAGLRAEAYVGTKKFGDQLKYADKRGAAIAVIEGADERAAGGVTLKDLKRGAELSKDIESRAEWLGERQAQVTVPRDRLVQEVKAMLTRGRW